MKRTHSLLISTVISLVLLAPALSQPKQPPENVTIGLASDPRGFEALKAGFFDGSGEYYASLIMEPLFKLHTDGSIGPALATKWEQSEDGKTWTVTLRDKATFHDGSAFSAHDVASHFNRLINPKNKYRLRSYIEPIQRVEVVDLLTVRFILSQRWLAFLPNLTAPNMVPLIPSHKQVASGDHQRKPIGTGPFKLSSWKQGHEMILRRHDDYRDSAKKYPKRVTVRVLPDQGSRLAALRTGDIDISPFGNAEQIIAAHSDPTLTTFQHDASGGLFFLLNTSRKPLNDQRVRAAIAHAFDQKIFNKVIFQATRPVIEHVLGPGIDCGDIGHRKPDLKKARALLAQYGKPVKLTMPYNSERRQNIELLQQMLEQVGIALDIQPVDQNTRVKRVRGRKFDIVQLGTLSSPDMGSQLQFYSDSRSKASFSAYSDPQTDKLIDAMRDAPDSQSRFSAQCAISAKVNESAHLIFNGGARHWFFARKPVTGLSMTARGLIDLRGIRIAR